MQIRITVPCQHARLRELTTTIDEVLHEHGVAQQLRHDVRLIAEEVACNVVDHGGADQEPHTIVTDVSARDGQLIIEFRDDGNAFDPLSASAPDVDADIHDRPIGGLGLHLVRELADSLTYRREGGHNVLRVTLRDKRAA